MGWLGHLQRLGKEKIPKNYMGGTIRKAKKWQTTEKSKESHHAKRKGKASKKLKGGSEKYEGMGDIKETIDLNRSIDTGET